MKLAGCFQMRRSLWAAWPFVLLSCVSEALPHLHTVSNIPHTPTFRTVSWSNTSAVPAPTPAPSGSRTTLFFNSTEKHAGQRYPLLNTSSLIYPGPTGLSGSRFNLAPQSKNATNGTIHLPTPSNPNGFRAANTAPTGYGIHLQLTATGPIPTPTDASHMPLLVPGAPFPNGTAPGSPSVPTPSLVTAASTDLNRSGDTLTTPAARIAGTAGTGYLLPTGASQPSPGGSPPSVDHPSTLTAYTRTAVDDTIITVTDSAQASPTNGLTVTTFTAPDGTEKTLTFSAERARPTIRAAKPLENAQGSASSVLRHGPAWVEVDHIISTGVVREPPATGYHIQTSNPTIRAAEPLENSQGSTDSVSRRGPAWAEVDHIISTGVVKEPPATRYQIQTRPTPSRTQQAPSSPPSQTKSYDTTVYATVAPATDFVPFPPPSSAEYSLETKHAMEVEVLWHVIKLLQENREEYLKHPKISHILTELLQQLGETQHLV